MEIKPHLSCNVCKYAGNTEMYGMYNQVKNFNVNNKWIFDPQCCIVGNYCINSEWQCVILQEKGHLDIILGNLLFHLFFTKFNDILGLMFENFGFLHRTDMTYYHIEGEHGMQRYSLKWHHIL